MVRAQTHMIRKQSVKVNAAVQDAFALKRKIELLMEELAPKLSDMFDGLLAADEWLEIDRLDINIGDITEEELDKQLLQRILHSIRDKIDARRYNVLSVDGDNKKDDHRFVPIHEKNITGLLHFLKNGILPWWFEATSHGHFEEQLSNSFEALIQHGEDGSVKQVIDDLRLALQSPVAQQRLAAQFDDKIYLAVIQLLLLKYNTTAYDEIRKVFNQLFEVLKVKDRVDQDISKPDDKDRRGILIQIAKQAKQDLLVYLAMVDGSAGPVIKSWILEVYRSLQNFSLTKEQGFMMEDPVLKGYLPDILKSVSPGSASKIAVKDVDTDKPGKEDDIKSEKLVKVNGGDVKNETINIEGAIISNAGLILLAPFLPQLFGQCGIAEHNEIKDFNKAIAILHYIAYKNCDYREYDVFLNKVLCGLEDNQPIVLLDELSEEDKSEIEEMLSTAISYWTVLKSTSPDGLREGFLVRKGNLHHQYDDWFLHVEQSAFDALLQQLPWTIGFIKLPWMKKMIRTQWI